MNHRLITMFVLLAASLGFAEPVTPQEWIAKLGSADWAERQEAEDALVEMGTPASTAIQAALESGPESVEVRERLMAALARIQREGLLVGTPVTVDQTFETPEEAFAFLAKQVNLSVKPENPAAEQRIKTTKPVVLKLKNVPWLQAISQVRDTTLVDYQIDESTLVLLESPPSVVNVPQTYTGAIVLTPEYMRTRRTLDLSQKTASSSISLRLIVTSEPKVQFSTGTARLLIRSAIDGEGNSIGGQDVYATLGREKSSQMVANINLGKPKPNQVLKTLLGELQGDLITRSSEARVRVSDQLPHTVVLPDGEFEIVSVERVKNRWEMIMDIPRTAFGSATYTELLSNAPSTMRILDQKDRPMKVGRGVQKPNAGGAIQLGFTITSSDTDAEPTQIIWTIAAQTRGVRIPFELHDLPMPD